MVAGPFETAGGVRVMLGLLEQVPRMDRKAVVWLLRCGMFLPQAVGVAAALRAALAMQETMEVGGI